MLWSFESASLSPDGTEIEIEAFGIPDSTCWEFDHVTTDVDGDNLVVSLVYLGPESGQFCNIPCPLGTGTVTVPFDPPRGAKLNIIKNPATEPHCAETLHQSCVRSSDRNIAFRVSKLRLDIEISLLVTIK